MVSETLAPLFGWLLELNQATSIHLPADFTRANYILLGGTVVAFIATLFVKETHCKLAEKLPS
jgi:hypothetical protein